MKILVFPKDPNPYQKLLYTPLQSKVEVKYLENPLSSHTLGILILPFQILFYRINGFKIFHLHFIYPFGSPISNGILNSNISKMSYFLYYAYVLLFIKALQYKLVWTVHDLLWLKPQFINDLQAIKILSRLSDAKIIHSKSTLQDMHFLKINTDNSNIIPIGSYSSVYKNNISQRNARSLLCIKKNTLVFCFFGIIERYKGVLELIKNFVKLGSGNYKLMVIGKCTDSDLKKEIMTFKDNDNIYINLRFIPDDKIQTYINSADIIVCPFLAITSSSSVMLALSFGKPVICPKLGNLRDLPENVGFFYDQGDNDGLLKCIYMAIRNKNNLKVFGRNAYKYANSISWNMIAKKTINIYSSLDN